MYGGVPFFVSRADVKLAFSRESKEGARRREPAEPLSGKGGEVKQGKSLNNAHHDRDMPIFPWPPVCQNALGWGLIAAMPGPHYFERQAYTSRCGIYSRIQRFGQSLRCHIVDTATLSMPRSRCIAITNHTRRLGNVETHTPAIS